MAGIKNIYQMNGMMPTNKIEGKTIWDRHAQFTQMQYTPYCQFCGQEILQSNVDENGKSNDWQWEMENRMHGKCYRQKMMEHRGW